MMGKRAVILTGAAVAALATQLGDEPKPETTIIEEFHETRQPTRAERRRALSAERAGLVIPTELDTRRGGWDRRLLALIDRVYVDGVHVPLCVAYSVREGYAMPKGGQKVKGEVTVSRKPT